METLQPDHSKLSALGARRTPDVSLALSSSHLGGVKRDAQNERILEPAASSAHPGLAPTQGWDTSNTTTYRGPRSSKTPGKNMYGSLSSAIGPSKHSSHVNYTVSEDATESNLLNKLSRMLAILDESVLVHLVVITNTQAYKREPTYPTAHDITLTKKVAVPDISHISHGPSNSPGLGYPMAVGQVAEALRSAFIAKQQIAKINAKFHSWATSKSAGITKREMWYSLLSWYPALDEQRVRSVFDKVVVPLVARMNRNLIEKMDYLDIVSHALHGVQVRHEVSRMFSVLKPGPYRVNVADLIESTSSCNDHAKLREIIQDIQVGMTGYINFLNWYNYMYSMGYWNKDIV